MKPLELRVYEIFKNKLGQQVAETVIEYVDAKARQIYEEKKEFIATKEDIGQLRKEMGEMKVQIVETKSEIIKWSFVFWIGTVIAVLGGLFGILKLFFNK
jgi:hypothetical protein